MIGLALAEAMLRVSAKPTVPANSVLFSSAHWQLDRLGAVRHIPNEAVRLVAVYDDTIEFDVSFRTNRAGFVDHRDYPVDPDSRAHYAFVGNSFTHGMGADPWVPKLRDRLRRMGQQIDLYNLGVNGASVQHFRKLLGSVATDLPVSHVVIVAISNDFLRPWWVPVKTEAGIELCRPDGHCRRVRTVPFNATLPELIAHHREALAMAPRAPLDPIWKRLLWQSHLYRVVRRQAQSARQLVAPAVDVDDGTSLEHPRFLPANMEALAGIRADFPEMPIWLAHFPQREEVELDRYDLALDETAAALKMNYFPALTSCAWSDDMYHSVNGHPNAKGYESFARCLSQQVFNLHLERDPGQSNPTARHNRYLSLR